MLATKTFLFSDLRDYTRFVEQHGDSAAATLIADYRRIVRAELAHHEGGEVKTEGDSFYVVFSTTGSAVTCAAAILREAEQYSRRHPDRSMRIGIGIHAGEPVPHEGQYVGSAVIVAARLAQGASAGELLVTEVVRALLPRSVALPMEERIGLTLKGLDAPPRVFSVDWRLARAPATQSARAVTDTAIAAEGRATQQVLSPVIIGRDHELATLEDQLLEAIAGRGRALLVSGEAGLGKSALIRQFIEKARAHGVRVLTGECTEIEARRPFGPFIDAFLSGDLVLPPELSQGGPGALPAVEVERYKVHVAFAERLSEAARGQPIVLIIEDLHWADEATNELIPYLARKLRDDRVLLVATYRSDELHRLHPINHVLAELSRSRLADDVRLKKLTLEETGDVIRAALGLAQPATAEFRLALFERTEGNPFFVEEILRALVEKGELEYREGAWHRTKAVADLAIPASVRDAVQQRLLALEPRARKAMQIAAVIGQRFDFEILGAVSGLDETTLVDAIKSAIEAQLVREETDAAGNETYAFRHALSREAVLTELLQRERRMLHRSVAEAIERSVPAGSAERAEELAYHFDEARDTARAYRYHALAADRSIRMSAPGAAIRHLERAIEIAPEDDAALPELFLRLSDVSLTVADTARALRAAQEARATSASRGDLLAAGAAIHRVGLCQWYLGQTQQATDTVREGVALLEPLGPSAPLAACYAELARLAMIDQRRSDAIDIGERAARMAKEVGALETEIAATNTVGTALGMDRRDEGVAILRRGFAQADEHGFIAEAERALNNTIAVLMSGDAPFSEALRVHNQTVAYARKHGHRSDAQLNRECLYPFFDGDWDTALAVASEGANEGIWGAGREQLAAIIGIAREGPLPAHVARLEAAHRRLTSPGDSQWLASATASTHGYFIAEMWAQTIAAADPAYALIGTTEIGPTMGAGLAAVIAARELGDTAAEARWSAKLHSIAGRTASQRASRAYADVMTHGDAGDPAEGIEKLRHALTELADRPAPIQRIVLTQELVRRLVAAGATEEAAAALAPIIAFHRGAKATWYLSRLEAWARGLGLAVGTP